MADSRSHDKKFPATVQRTFRVRLPADDTNTTKLESALIGKLHRIQVRVFHFKRQLDRLAGDVGQPSLAAPLDGL